MRAPLLMLGLLSLALTPACGDKDDVPADDTSTPTGDDSEAPVIDSEPPEPQDQDRDGFTDDVDCEDNNYAIYPGAPEDCDGVDQDCDDIIDEGFDADEDGALSQADCEAGTDCDDADATIGPDAEEVPYDGIDQDCDGEDLIDVDGDGYRGVDGGGTDCDDTDPSIFPGAEEVPLDEIDQDCDGLDDLDGDGDGYDSAEAGGDDCDDADPSVNPGALDFSHDGLDVNCDGSDSTRFDLTDSTMYIEGTGTRTDLVGRGLDLCDFDEDGLADLVIGAPFLGSSYESAVGIWYGSGWSTWSAGMYMESADTFIQGDNNYEFFGFEALCGDFNGDGHLDLVTGRGEIDYSALSVDTDYSLLVFFGDGMGFGATLGDDDADAELSIEMDPVDAGTVYSAPLGVGDIDGDGSDDLLISIGSDQAALFDGEERVLVLPGAAWSGQISLSAELSHVLVPEQPYEATEASVLSDLDGDGHPDVAVLSSSYTSDYFNGDSGNTGDSGDSGYLLEGRVSFLGDLSSPAADPLDIADTMYSSHRGGNARLQYGLRLVEGDFTGDGVSDLVVSALGESPAGRPGSGGIFLFDAAAVDLTTPDLDVAALSDADAYGDIDYAYVGYSMAPAGDMDGDGTEDLFVTSPGGGLSNVGEIYLIGGHLLTGSIAELDDAALLTWRGESSDSFNGYDVASGADIDGDGINDAAFVSSGWDSANSSSYSSGRVYIFLSGSP